jgi:putative glycosyltransferase (TIGR04372 family)
MRIRIENFLLNKSYFIVCPRSYSLGGFFISLNEGLKIASFKKKKLIICFLLLNNHSKHFKKKIFSKQILFEIFLKLSLSAKVMSIILSIYVNINLFLERIKILSLLKLFFSLNFIQNYFFTRIGYDGYSNYFITTNEEWKKALIIKNNFIFRNNDIQKKINKSHFVTIYAKDKNYNKISEISSYGLTDIDNYSQSIKYFIDKGFEVIRVGDQLSNNFSFNSSKYYDFTRSNIFNLKNQYCIYEKSNFYFGAYSPGSLIANFFNKNFVIPSLWSFSSNAQSFSLKNFVIYKKVFSIKKEKILSLSEIFSRKEYFVEELTNLYNEKEFILIENSQSEILNLCKAFYSYNYSDNNLIKKKSKLLDEYCEIRKNAINKVYKTSVNANLIPSINRYYCGEVNLPDFFLEKYLYPSKFLEEESLFYKNKFKL